MERKRRIAILGSTGSIGTQTLDVIRAHRDLFEVVLVSSYGNNLELLASQAKEFDADSAVVCAPSSYEKLSSMLSSTDCKVFEGVDSLCRIVSSDSCDIVVGAMVGFSGLRPVLAALEAGKIVALANKETLVAAGDIVTTTMRKHGGVILPVDSEHSAIFQCLMAANGNPARRILLTASGGPFRGMKREEISRMTAREALRHPNWKMGAKVTIDSSTMMNKGLEVIEAKWLFDADPSMIEVVIHPESIIHSMVEFTDGAVIAQMGNPDMRQPIGFALAFPERIEVGNRRLDFPALSSLSFEKPDLDAFPCLGLAYEAIRRGGNVPCVMNAANEVAVKAFLEDRIGFYDIPAIVEKCMDGAPFAATPSLDDIFATNEETAARANELIR